MTSRIFAKAALVLAAIAVALAPTAGGASPIGTFNCVAQGTFKGTYSQIEGLNVWNWALTGKGTCTNVKKVFDFRIAFALRFHNGAFPGPVTFSPSQPWPTWRIQSSLTDSDGAERQFPQVWDGIGASGAFEIHHYDTSVPHPTLAVGGLTGLGATTLGPRMGTWASPTIKARFAFTFGTDAVPLPPISMSLGARRL
jgi:hypothetical protein